MTEVTNSYEILVGNPEVHRPGGRPGCRWNSNMKEDLKDVGFENMDWIRLTQEGPYRGGLL